MHIAASRVGRRSRTAAVMSVAALSTGSTGAALAAATTPIVFARYTDDGVLEDLYSMAARLWHAGGLWAAESGTADAALMFERALGSPRISGHPMEHARVLLGYGRFLRSQRSDESRAVPREALTRFEWLTATPWALQARAELRATGVRVPGEHAPPAVRDAQPAEAQDPAAGGQGALQPGHRRTPVHLTSYGGLPPLPFLPARRCPVPGRARSVVRRGNA